MKLLFVIDSFGSGGAQRQMVSLAVGLKKRGHNVEFFTYYPQYDHFASQVSEAGIFVHSCKKANRFSLNVVWLLRKRIKKEKYDLVLSFLDTPNLYAEIAMLGVKHTRLVISERFMYGDGPLPWTKVATQEMHRLADYITVNSHHQCNRMVTRFPWMRKNIRTIYNGVDLSTFSPKEGAEKDTGTTISANGCAKILVLSSIVPKKNAIGLIRALAIYAEQYGMPPFISWAGKQVQSVQGQKWFAEADQMLDSLSMRNYWSWLGERQDIPALLADHDALIHPSFFEGLPNAICEALAAGRPVLAGNVCDNDLLVHEGKNGFLFTPEDPKSIADALHRFVQLTDKERLFMGQSSRAMAETELNLHRFVDQYETLFRDLCHFNTHSKGSIQA